MRENVPSLCAIVHEQSYFQKDTLAIAQFPAKIRLPVRGKRFLDVKFLERGRGRISFETQFSRLEQRLRRTVGSGSPPISQ